MLPKFAAGLAVAGAALSTAGLLGVGTTAAAASGTAGHYRLTHTIDAFTGQTRVVRWAPCLRLNGVTRVHVIHYRIHTAGLSGRVRLAKEAVARVAYRTG